jgi:hypothetical protein
MEIVEEHARGTGGYPLDAYDGALK